MTKLFKSFACATLLLSLNQSIAAPNTPPATKAPVIVLQYAHDGDTIRVFQDTQNFYVRFSDIDAPELKQEFGPESRDHLKALLANKFLSLQIKKDRDMFGRPVARVFADKLDVNAQMVKDGYAWYFGTYSKDKTVQALEAEARLNKRGLWSKPNPVPPWTFRKESKKKKI